MIDVLVLSRGVHGMPVEDYAAAIEARLPNRTVTLARTPAAERELLPEARVATGLALTPDTLTTAEHLELFACTFAGTDHLSLEAFREHDVTVTNASGVHGPNVSEFVIAGILAHVHRLAKGRARQERTEWRSYQKPELAGDTVMIVGLGAIGTAVVERLQGFDVETIGVRQSPTKGGPTDEVIGPDGEAFAAALARTDHLVLACPLTEATRGLIGHDEFRVLPSDALLVNIARGPVVDTDALVDALRKNLIDGAVLDVTDPEPLPPDHPLWSFQNVRITPHNAGATPQYYARRADILATNVERLRSDDPLENVVT